LVLLPGFVLFIEDILLLSILAGIFSLKIKISVNVHATNTKKKR